MSRLLSFLASMVAENNIGIHFPSILRRDLSIVRTINVAKKVTQPAYIIRPIFGSPSKYHLNCILLVGCWLPVIIYRL